MNLGSRITQERIERAVMARFSAFPELTMERLGAMLNSFRAGELRECARAWEIMLERDGDLATVYEQRRSDVAKLPWHVDTVDDSPDAARHAKALRWCYENIRVTHAIDQDISGGMRTLISQIMSAHAHRYSVHEMLIIPENPAALQVTFELRHCPVYWFEARRGRLAYLPYEGSTYGTPLQPGEWLRAVGHGYMRQCSVGYLIKWLPMAAWVIYTQRHGVPGIHGETDAKPGSKEWADFSTACAQFANDFVAVTNTGAKINLIQATGAADAQFAPLIDRVDRMYAKLFRGGDLSTNSRSDAVGASIQGEEKDTGLEDDAEFVTDTLNEQIDRPLIRYLFGREPLAWVCVEPPKRLSVDQDLKSAGFLIDHGVLLPTSEVTERLGWREAEDGEDALGGSTTDPTPPTVPNPAPAADPATPPADPAKAALANEQEKLATNALRAIAAAAADDMKPLRDELQRIEGLDTMEAKRLALFNLLDRLPDFATQVLRAPSAAGPLGDLLGTAYVNQLVKSRSNA